MGLHGILPSKTVGMNSGSLMKDNLLLRFDHIKEISISSNQILGRFIRETLLLAEVPPNLLIQEHLHAQPALRIHES